MDLRVQFAYENSTSNSVEEAVQDYRMKIFI